MKMFLKSKLMFLALGGALLIMALTAVALNSPNVSHAAPAAMISLNPAKVAAGAKVTVTGSGWTAGHVVNLNLDKSATVLASATVASDGTFEATLTVPATGTVGMHSVVAVDKATKVVVKATLTVIASPSHK